MSIAGAQNCLDFMQEIIDTVPLDHQYTIDLQKAWYSYYGNHYRDKYDSGNYDMRDYDVRNYTTDDYPKDYELPCDHCKHGFDCINCPESFF